jgi:hypothetical protein
MPNPPAPPKFAGNFYSEDDPTRPTTGRTFYISVIESGDIPNPVPADTTGPFGSNYRLTLQPLATAKRVTFIVFEGGVEIVRVINLNGVPQRDQKVDILVPAPP